MTARKQTEDHKPKVQPPDKPRHMNVMGLEFDVDVSRFDDLEFVESLWNIQHANEGGDPFAIVPFLRDLTGLSVHEISQALKDPQTGRTSMETVEKFVEQVLQEAAPKS